jgi:hypothetical protein
MSVAAGDEPGSSEPDGGGVDFEGREARRDERRRGLGVIRGPVSMYVQDST